MLLQQLSAFEESPAGAALLRCYHMTTLRSDLKIGDNVLGCSSIFKCRGHQPQDDLRLKISGCNVRPILLQNGGSRISILIRFIG
jgi:hypothetical protein